MRLRSLWPLAAIALTSLLPAGAAFAGQTEGAAPTAPKKVYTTTHINPHAPAIDGQVNDDVWARN